MHVCQIIESTSGGSVRVALDLTKHLLDAGDQVTFIYSPKRADQRFLDEIKTIKEAKFIPVVMHRSVGLHDLISGVKLFQLLKKEGPFDVIHAHSSKAGGLMRLASLFLPRATRIYTPHAFITMSPQASGIYGVIESMLSFLCEGIITVSQAEKEHAVKDLGIRPSLMYVVPNGVAFEKKITRTEACAAVGVSPDDFIVGFVGRFVAQKNPLRLIEAFTLIRKQKPKAKLIMVGDGELMEQVKKAAHKAGHDKHIIFCTDHKARALMPAFDVLCCSSDYEGIPLVFLECLSVGVPVVTTPVGGTQEAVVESKTGYVAKEFTPQALAVAVMKVATQTQVEKKDMRILTLKHSCMFTVNRMGKHVRTIYQELLK